MQSTEITVLLNQLNTNDSVARDQLFTILYDELKKTAKSVRKQWRGNDTLNTTALVHETFIKLFPKDLEWENRCQFFYIAGKAMRQVLCNYAEKRNAQKRCPANGKSDINEIEDIIPLDEKTILEILCLENLLNSLENQDPIYGKVIECRFYGDMTIKETAQVLDISQATVKRKWNFARAFLYKELNESPS